MMKKKTKTTRQREGERATDKLMEVGVAVDGLLAGEELEEDDAEAVDVGLLGEPGGAGVLRVDVADGADDEGGGVGLAGGDAPGYAEVRQVGLEVLVQKDVRGLHVPVDDPRVAVMVEVGQALRCPHGDPQPRLPVQLHLLVRPCNRRTR